MQRRGEAVEDEGVCAADVFQFRPESVAEDDAYIRQPGPVMMARAAAGTAENGDVSAAALVGIDFLSNAR